MVGTIVMEGILFLESVPIMGSFKVNCAPARMTGVNLPNTLDNEKHGGITMVRHMVCWNYKDGFTEKENDENAKKIKEGLENLKNLIDGIVSIEVITNQLPTSAPDLVLNCVFKDAAALDRYQVHEEHVKVAQFVRSVTQNRYCIDYIEN